ncbi:MAG: glycosyltransferase family protein [Lachnospiraceae bacterium]|nr:glycosyltransferase family protein [Lachnospiraceae bacterium]
MRRKSDEHKFAAIICSNDETYLNECLLYLSLLNIPEGYEFDTLVIPDAVSMAGGYNEGMNSTNAKYKIYLHQDTFIREKYFLHHILKIFASDSSIGMIGMVGAARLSKNAVMWETERIGNLYRLEKAQETNANINIKISNSYITDVEVIDGFLMATQADISWREDIFDGWDFYDVSQSTEFRQAGYRVVVPGQVKAWCIHDCGNPRTGKAYEFYQKKYLETYHVLRR